MIGDEVHEFEAKSLISIMCNLKTTHYRFGFTGTIDEGKTNGLTLTGLFGPVRKIITSKELIERGLAAPFRVKAIVLHYPDAACRLISSAKTRHNYREEVDWLVANSKRNEFIRNLALSLRGNTFVFYRLVGSHGEELYRLIKEGAGPGRPVFFVSGDVEGEERLEIVSRIEKEKDAIGVVSYGTFSTGMNVINLHNLIAAHPYKSKNKILQTIGRGLRKSQNGQTTTLYDITDDLSWKKSENTTLQHYRERINIYNAEMLDYKIYKVALPYD